MATSLWIMLANLACLYPFFDHPARVFSEPAVLCGLDVLSADHFRPLHGKAIGLITNHTGRDRQGRHIVDLILQTKKVRVAALFAPEHGFRGQEVGGDKIPNRLDAASRLPIYSLYGAVRKPTPEMLKGVEALVFDMQDAGARFYTYLSTMALALQAAAAADIEFYVLDRPNPLGGRVEGPLLEAQHRSFVGIHPIALRHGMTMGELAQMFLGEGWIFSLQDSNNSARPAQTHWQKLRIMRMQNWRPDMLFGETGLPWIAPSPNMTSPQAALLYPGMGLLEATNFSEGRGTPRPFEVIGAPWLNVKELMKELRDRVPEVACDSIRFTPIDIPGKALNPKFENQECRGLQFTLIDPPRLQAVKLGITLLCALQKIHPREFKIDAHSLARLSGTGWLTAMIMSGHEPENIWRKIETDAEAFRRLRQKYLLYEN